MLHNNFPADTGRRMPELVEMLVRYRLASEAACNQALTSHMRGLRQAAASRRQRPLRRVILIRTFLAGDS